MEQVSSILDFSDGSIIERINYELQKVLENVVHPNTDEKPRKLVVEITITPVNGRRSVSLNTTVKKTLRPTSSVQTQMVFQTLNGEMKAYLVFASFQDVYRSRPTGIIIPDSFANRRRRRCLYIA